MFVPIIPAPALPNTIDNNAPILIIALLITAVSNSESAFNSSLDADYGSLAIFINFCIISSIGSMINVSMSFEKKCNISTNTIQTNKVLPIENKA